MLFPGMPAWVLVFPLILFAAATAAEAQSVRIKMDRSTRFWDWLLWRCLPLELIYAVALSTFVFLYEVANWPSLAAVAVITGEFVALIALVDRPRQAWRRRQRLALKMGAEPGHNVLFSAGTIIVRLHGVEAAATPQAPTLWIYRVGDQIPTTDPLATSEWRLNPGEKTPPFTSGRWPMRRGRLYRVRNRAGRPVVERAGEFQPVSGW